MTLALNTSHPLYADLGMFVCVNEAGTALVDLCTPARTFTKHASAVFGTGTYGRHAGARRDSPSGYSSYGFTFDTPYTPANNTGTLIVVTNAVTSVQEGGFVDAAFIGSGDASYGTRRLPQLGINGGKVAAACFNNSGGDMTVSGNTTTAAVGASARMWTLVRDGETSHAIYVNGNTTPEVSGGKLGANETVGYYSYIGGIPGAAPIDFDGVYFIRVNRALTPTEIADLYATLGANNAFGLIEAPPADTTAPTLTSPTGTSTGTTTASGTVTTDEANGTLYALATINATETAATVKASSNTQAITTTGSKAVSFTGLTASTTYYAHYVHRDAAGNDSTRVSSASFTTSASGDSTPPTLTGAITSSAITSSGFTVSWPAGSDNVAVTGYEYSLNGGSSWTDAGNVLIKTVSGLTASTPYSVQVRDYDAAGNRALTPLSATITTSAAPGAGTITTNPMTTPNGLPLTSHTAHLGFDSVATGQQVLYKSSQVSHATTGRMTVTDIALVPGTDYCVTTIDPNAAPGDPCGARVYQAS